MREVASVAKRVLEIAVMIVVLVILVGAVGLWRAGELRILAPHFAGSCAALPMAANATDIRVDAARHVAYLSYLDTRSLLSDKHTHGTVMLLDLNAPEPHIRAALVSDPANFRPRALSLYAPPKDVERLFVVSGVRAGEYSVEIFQQTETGAFAPTETVRDPLLVSPTAILAVGPRQFYVTDDAGMANGWPRIKELFVWSGRSKVLYFDGQKLTTVANGLDRATGLAATADGRRLYVSEAGAKQLHVYDRDLQTAALRSDEVIALDSAPGGINVDSRGNLWIAAHPKALTLLWHLHSGSRKAPTQVLKLNPAAHGNERITEVYLNRGEQLSAGSVAAVYNARMVLGALEERQLLVCALPR